MRPSRTSDPSPTEVARTRLRWLAWGSVVAASGLLALFRLHNDDAFFHIATGRWIRAHGQVPLTNPFSYAADGATWLQHQWLPAVGMSLIADHLGLAGLVVVKALLVMAVFGGLALHLGRGRVPVGVGALLLAAGVAGSAFRFYERPYLTSAVVLAVVACLLMRQAARGVRDRRALVAAALATALAWQLHAGALHSVLAWGAFAGGVTLRALTQPAPGHASTSPPKLLRRAWSGVALMAVLSLLSLWALAPSGLSVVTLPVRFSADAYWNAHLSEFRPLRWSWTYAPQWLAVASAAAVTLVAVRARRWDAVLLVAGFAALAVRHQRLVWVMVIAALAAAGTLPWPAAPAPGPAPPTNPGAAPSVLRKFAGLTTCLALAAAIVAGAWWDQSRWFRLGLGEDGLDHRRHPVALLRAAGALPGETLVSDGLAGTWLWLNFADRAPNGDPLPLERQRRVLVHNCLECYRPSTYVDLYQHIRYGLPGWEDKVEALHIRSFVLKHTTGGERRFQNGQPNLRQHLFARPEWTLVDFDDVASVYVATRAAPAGLATLADFPVDPDTGRARPGADERAVLLALIDHALARPHTVRTLDMAARRAWRGGRRALALQLLGEVGRRQADGPTVRQLEAMMGAAATGTDGRTLAGLRGRLAETGQGERNGL